MNSPSSKIMQIEEAKKKLAENGMRATHIITKSADPLFDEVGDIDRTPEPVDLEKYEFVIPSKVKKVGTFMGMELWEDEALEDGKWYLIDCTKTINLPPGYSMEDFQ